MKFKIGADEGGREFGICSSTCTSAPDFWCDVVKFFAVLLRLAVDNSWLDWFLVRNLTRNEHANKDII